MKRKSLLFALLLALFMPWAANAQETVEIGTDGGTTTNSYLPAYTLYNNTLSEQIYTAEEVTMAGTISSISFYNGGSTKSPEIKLYLVNTDKSEFTSTTDWLTVTAEDLVFDGTVTFTAGEWTTIEFTNEFEYDGTSNLGVVVDEHMQWSSGLACRVFTSTDNCSLYHYDDNVNFDATNPASGNSSNRLGVKNQIKLVITPAQQGGDVCEKPETCVASDVTSTSATLTWSGGSGTYNVEVKGGSYTDWTAVLQGTNLTTATLTLQPTTSYQARVQSVCTGDTPTSGWKTSAAFTTTCDTYNIPYTYGFEEEAPFNCWTVISGNITRATGNMNTGNYYLDFRGTTSNMIALPQFNEATNNLRVEFYTRPESTSGSSGKFAIGYMTDITDASTFVAVDTYNSTQMTPSYVKKTVDLVNVPANANIAMRQFDCSTNYYWYVDDVTVKEMPSCLAPTGLAANASTTSAELSWTANSGETAWTLYWKESGATDYTEVANATNPYTLNGLTAATNYEFYVVANCSADDASEASEVFTFATACDVIAALGYSENFDSYTAGNNVLPTCWNYINTTTYSSYQGYPRVFANGSYSTYAHSAPNCLYLYSYYSSWTDYDPQPQYAILPEMTGLAGKQVTLMAKGYSSTSTFKIGTMSDPTDASTFTMIAEQTLTTNYPEEAFEYIIPTNCTDSYLAIMIDAANESRTSNGVYIDDIAIVEAPSCIKPTGLEATTNAFTATITWVSEVGEYEVAHATDATATPDENIAGTTTEETYTMNDLALGDHYFWVRANCGSDGYSEWVGPVSVHIGYCVPTPSNVDGNGISNVTFGMGDNIVNNDTPKAMYADYSSQIGAVQAGVESTIAITYATGYDYGTIIWVDLDNSLSFEDSEIMFVGNAPNSTAPYNAAITIPATQTPGDYMMRIGGADSGFDSYISDPSTTAPSACYNGSWACFQDYTLRVLEAPSCLLPTNVAVNYTGGNTAEVTWVGTADTYNIMVGEEVTEGVTSPYTLQDLDMATSYTVKVQANCEDDETSEWTEAVSFTTDLCMPEDMCEITFELTDSYGDSWNGAAINVVDVVDNTIIATMTADHHGGGGNPSTDIKTLAVCDGREIQFVWVSGNYDDECSYVVKDVNGVEIFSGEEGMDEPVNYTVDCGFVSYTLTIEGYEDDNNAGGYYLIASPVTVDLTNHEMTTGNYDLYAFDQAEEDEWRNYKQNAFSLEPGKGYLYAHKIGGEFTLTGTAYSGDGAIELTYDENATSFQGWNLVGNPWSVKAYPNRAFYTMAEGGAGIDVTPSVAGTEVAPMTGIFVVAEAANETVTFSTEAPANTDGKIALNLTNSNKLVDRAIVRFGEGRQLPKFQLNPNHTKVYFQQEGKDYAIVNATEMGEMPVSFKAENNGTYSLSFTSEEVSFSYLHLIDNMTGNDVNLLANPSYSFDAKSTDYANRFKLVFATGNNNGEDFAFFSNGSFVINNDGEATLQVVDVTGRILKSESVNGCANVNFNAASGVYMLRLVNGDNVKVQKVVVR